MNLGKRILLAIGVLAKGPAVDDGKKPEEFIVKRVDIPQAVDLPTDVDWVESWKGKDTAVDLERLWRQMREDEARGRGHSPRMLAFLRNLGIDVKDPYEAYRTVYRAFDKAQAEENLHKARNQLESAELAYQK